MIVDKEIIYRVMGIEDIPSVVEIEMKHLLHRGLQKSLSMK